MAILREGTNPVWGIFMICYVLGTLGLDFYWLFTHSGLLRWVAQKEASLFKGVWYPKITFLLLLLVQIGAMLLIKLTIEAFTKKSLTAPAKERE